MKLKELNDTIVESLFESLLEASPKTSTYFTDDETDNWWKSFKYIRYGNRELQSNALAILGIDSDLDFLGEVIGQDNDEKWSRLLSIYYANYEALKDINITEEIDETINKDVTEDVKSKNESEGSHSQSNAVYGFNSATAVPTDESESTTDNTSTSLKADNQRVLADDTVTDHNLTKVGNSRPISELYAKEWKNRLNNIIDVIMSDIADYIVIDTY